jgi:hypothetical protein
MLHKHCTTLNNRPRRIKAHSTRVSNHVTTASSAETMLKRSCGYLRYAVSALAMQAVPAVQFCKLEIVCDLAVSSLSISLFLIIRLSTETVRFSKNMIEYTNRNQRVPNQFAEGLSSCRHSHLHDNFPTAKAPSLCGLYCITGSPKSIICLASTIACVHAAPKSDGKCRTDRETQSVPRIEDTQGDCLRLNGFRSTVPLEYSGQKLTLS